MRRIVRLAVALFLVACTKPTPPVAELQAAVPAPVDAGPPLSVDATTCTALPPATGCFRFATPQAAFQHVLALRPTILGIGESHAPADKGVASSTARFTNQLLPLVAPAASDIVVELWAPDPRCTKEAKAVASAQRPIIEAQAETNQNEYVVLGTEAKAAGMTPWLLRPTCDDFTMLADAGADSIGAMLELVKRLTASKITQLHARRPDRIVIAYGGALHNDLSPPESTRPYSFGPELDQLVPGRYVELDLIVPEFVKKTQVWEKLPWYASFQAAQTRDGTTLYQTGERSFVLVFARTK